MRPRPPWIRAPLMSVLIPFSGSGNEQARDPAILKLRQFGFDVTDKDLTGPYSPPAPMLMQKLSPEQTMYCVLPGPGMDHYHYLTRRWMPRSDRVCAFDAEALNVERMCTLFLKGVDAIVPEITITDVTEDLSGITDEARPHPDDPIMNTDGTRGVSFRRNRRDCSLEMTGEGPGAAAA